MEKVQRRIPNRNMFVDVNWLHPESQVRSFPGEPFSTVRLEKGKRILP